MVYEPSSTKSELDFLTVQNDKQSREARQKALQIQVNLLGLKSSFAGNVLAIASKTTAAS